MRSLLVIFLLALVGCSEKETKLYTPLPLSGFVGSLEKKCVEEMHGTVDSNDSHVVITNYEHRNGREDYEVRAVVVCRFEDGVITSISDNYGGGSGLKYDVEKEPK